MSVDFAVFAYVSIDASSRVLGSIRGVLEESVDGNREIDAVGLYNSVSALIMVACEAHQFPTLVSSRYLSTPF